MGRVPSPGSSADRARQFRRHAERHGARLLLSGVQQLSVALLLAYFLLRDGAMMRRRLEAGLARLIGAEAFGLLGLFVGPMRFAVAWAIASPRTALDESMEGYAAPCTSSSHRMRRHLPADVIESALR